MTIATRRHQIPSTGVHVQVQGWKAQCPRCEANSFQPAARQQYTCTSCGAATALTALLNQVACNARLTAEVLAGYAKLAAQQAN